MIVVVAAFLDPGRISPNGDTKRLLTVACCTLQLSLLHTAGQLAAHCSQLKQDYSTFSFLIWKTTLEIIPVTKTIDSYGVKAKGAPSLTPTKVLLLKLRNKKLKNVFKRTISYKLQGTRADKY